MDESTKARTRWSRRELLGFGATGALVAGAGLSIPLVSTLKGRSVAAGTPEGDSRLGEVYRLQAAFHRAKTTGDIDLMMSLWEEGATLISNGDPNSPYVGSAKLKAYWLNTGSFLHSRLSLVPSYKIRIAINGDQADLYFECHDVADYADPKLRSIVNDTFLAGTIRWAHQAWRFSSMTAGQASPLSPDHYYFP